MEALFDRLMMAFSVEFIFTVIMATYFTIKTVEMCLCGKSVPRWIKKFSTIVVGLIVFVVFTIFTEIPKETLLSSYFAALFFYDYAIKWLLEKVKADYK